MHFEMIPFVLVMTSSNVKWRRLTRHLGITIWISTLFQKSRNFKRKLMQNQAIILLNCTNSWNSVISVMEKTKKSEKIWLFIRPKWNLKVAMTASKRMDTYFTYKNSVENEGKTAESLSLRVNRRLKTLKTPSGGWLQRHHNPTPPPHVGQRIHRLKRYPAAICSSCAGWNRNHCELLSALPLSMREFDTPHGDTAAKWLRMIQVACVISAREGMGAIIFP